MVEQPVGPSDNKAMLPLIARSNSQSQPNPNIDVHCATEWLNLDSPFRHHDSQPVSHQFSHPWIETFANMSKDLQDIAVVNVETHLSAQCRQSLPSVSSFYPGPVYSTPSITSEPPFAALPAPSSNSSLSSEKMSSSVNQIKDATVRCSPVPPGSVGQVTYHRLLKLSQE
ncbi:hypothetical protein EHS25_000914 [Saitozyma podzolica]|uniref:Uncharacterized protein n=1 Tax=Saitozyma podzolica TaxID=1890683 RepID=A0A427YXM0_9TREE|nr:hypothetical protein EHS25_000914 [Saitozyma podzolica]